MLEMRKDTPGLIDSFEFFDFNVTAWPMVY